MDEKQPSEIKEDSGKKADRKNKKDSGFLVNSGNENKDAEKKKKGNKRLKRSKSIQDVDSELTAEMQVINTVTLNLSLETQERFQLITDIESKEDEHLFYIQKANILDDINKLAAGSEFFPYQNSILNYTGNEFAIVFNSNEKQFTLALTMEARHDMEKNFEEEEEEDPTKNINYEHDTPTARPWISLGSETYIDEGLLFPRKKVKMLIKRERKYFGAFIKFTNRDTNDHKECIAECVPNEDQLFTLERLEIDRGIQAIPATVTVPVQTTWRFPKNASTQYEPRQMSEEMCDAIISSNNFKTFLFNVLPLLQDALQQNVIMNVFIDDWANLGHELESFTTSSDNQLKDFQSFTDMQYSKMHKISCIAWHPKLSGIVAVSMTDRRMFDQRIDEMIKNYSAHSYVLVWSFVDPIRPQLLLEAPDDIATFKFSPTDPQYIAGGCWNGQIILWDLSDYIEYLLPKIGHKNNKKMDGKYKGDDAIPIVRYCASSNIEHSHNQPIYDIQWFPKNYELTKQGTLKENEKGRCVQLITCSVDQSLIFWDLRTSAGNLTTEKPENLKKIVGAVPTTFKHLDLVWKPWLKMSFPRNAPGGDHAPTKFCINLQNEDPYNESLEEITVVKDKMASDTSFAIAPDFGTVKTNIFVGTEDGEMLYINWEPAKDQDTGKIATKKAIFKHLVHPSEIVALERNPLYRDLVLCCGGGSFSLWVDGCFHGPILQSKEENTKITAACWSLTRPSVFYITRFDGMIEVWDLMNSTHKPLLSQSVATIALTSIAISHITPKKQIIAIGDDQGTLHILEIPNNLRLPQADELENLSNYVIRERKRLDIFTDRLQQRKTDPDAFNPLATVRKIKMKEIKVANTEEEDLAEYMQFLEDQIKFIESVKAKLMVASQTAGSFNPNYVVSEDIVGAAYPC